MVAPSAYGEGNGRVAAKRTSGDAKDSKYSVMDSEEEAVTFRWACSRSIASPHFEF